MLPAAGGSQVAVEAALCESSWLCVRAAKRLLGLGSALCIGVSCISLLPALVAGVG
jgi:hypothetical protein